MSLSEQDLKRIFEGYPEGTVRWRDRRGQWHYAEPQEPTYSTSLMIADQTFRKGKWEHYAP